MNGYLPQFAPRAAYAALIARMDREVQYEDFYNNLESLVADYRNNKKIKEMSLIPNMAPKPQPKEQLPDWVTDPMPDMIEEDLPF